MPAVKRLLAFAVVLAVLGAAAYAWTGPPESWWRLERMTREGPPMLVEHGGRAHLWVLVKLDERRFFLGSQHGGRHHVELRAHDAATTELVWRRRLLSFGDGADGRNARARILGPDGDVVWLFLHDQPVAATIADGTLVAGRPQIEAGSPALKGILSAEPSHYAFDTGLVITTADARRLRVRAPDFKASDYVPPSEEHFRRIRFMATQWNGGFETKDFLVRTTRADGRWIGLLSELEAREVAEDEFGTALKQPERIRNEGAMARRTLWTARTAPNRFRDGDRLVDLAPFARGDDAFLQGGFLARAGVREPYADAGGVLVLHRTRIDAEGRLALTRLDRGFARGWSTTLPIADLANRWEVPRGALLLYGATAVGEPGTARHHEFLVAIDPASGAARSWNLTLGTRVAP